MGINFIIHSIKSVSVLHTWKERDTLAPISISVTIAFITLSWHHFILKIKCFCLQGYMSSEYLFSISGFLSISKRVKDSWFEVVSWPANNKHDPLIIRLFVQLADLVLIRYMVIGPIPKSTTKGDTFTGVIWYCKLLLFFKSVVYSFVLGSG